MTFSDWQLTATWSKIVIDATTGASSDDTEGDLTASWTTTKDRKFVFDATTIPLVSGGGDKIAKYLISGWDETSVSTDGVVTLKLKRADGKGTYDTTFKQADTAFYKAHAIKTFKLGGGFTNTGSPGFTNKEYNPSIGDSSITWADDKKSGTCNYEADALTSGVKVIYGKITINTTTSYNAGWTAACSSF